MEQQPRTKRGIRELPPVNRWRVFERDHGAPPEETAMTDRERIIDLLRNIAPGHPVGRIWGRRADATADEAQEGNVWAADVEDIATLVLAVLTGHGTIAEIMEQHGRGGA